MEVRSQREEIVRLYDRFVRDNESIYFEKEEDFNKIVLPEGVSLMKSTPVTLPLPKPIEIKLKEGSTCAIQ